MKNWLICGVFGVVVACGGGKKMNTDTVVLIDAKVAGADAPATAACNVLTQMGCNTGERCTWVHSTEPTPDTPALGSIQCVADSGTAATGSACTYGPAGTTGFDTCIKGDICVHSTCKLICDNNGGAPMCPTMAACVTYDSLFANSGATTTPAGACDPTCNPITDNDFDGSGTQFTRPGSNCGTDPVTGCYGNISTTHTTFFTCSTPVSGTGQLTHRSVIPVAKQFLNACMSGYGIAFAGDATGSMNIDCYAFCSPGDAFMGNTATQQPNGVAPHRCNNNDALGAFGATPNVATNSNGEHCMYSWRFEVDTMGTLHSSPTDDTVGICWDHTKYMYDSNGDGTVDTVVEACTTVPITTAAGATTSNAVELGCMKSTLIPAPFGKGLKISTRYIENFPEMVALPKQ